MDSESPPVIALGVELDSRISFAMQQNDVPVVKTLRIENLNPEPLRELTVRILAEPDFAEEWTARVAAVNGESTYQLDAVDLQLSPGFLSELTERVRGRLVIEVTRAEERLRAP